MEKNSDKLFIILDVGSNKDVKNEGENESSTNKENAFNINFLNTFCKKKFNNCVKYLHNYHSVFYNKSKPNYETLTFFTTDYNGNICGTGESIHEFIKQNYCMEINDDFNLLISLIHHENLSTATEGCTILYPAVGCNDIYTDNLREYDIYMNHPIGTILNNKISILNFSVYFMTAVTLLVLQLIHLKQCNISHNLNTGKKLLNENSALNNNLRLSNNEIKSIYRDLFQKSMRNFSRNNNRSLEAIISEMTVEVLHKAGISQISDIVI